MSRDKRLESLNRMKAKLEKELAEVQREIDIIHQGETAEAITQRGAELGIVLYQGMEIRATKEMADYVIKDNPRWVNPPGQVGDSLKLEYVTKDGMKFDTTTKHSNWSLYFPNEMIARALQEGD